MQPAGADAGADLRPAGVDNRLPGAHQDRNGLLPDAERARREPARRRSAPDDPGPDRVRAAVRSVHLRRDRLVRALLPEGQDEAGVPQRVALLERVVRAGAGGQPESADTAVPGRRAAADFAGEADSEGELVRKFLRG